MGENSNQTLLAYRRKKSLDRARATTKLNRNRVESDLRDAPERAPAAAAAVRRRREHRSPSNGKGKEQTRGGGQLWRAMNGGAPSPAPISFGCGCRGVFFFLKKKLFDIGFGGLRQIDDGRLRVLCQNNPRVSPLDMHSN